MRTWNLESRPAREAFWEFIKQRIADGKSATARLIEDTRSLEQNALSHALYGQIAAQLGDQSAREVKAECKLRFGIPILLEHDMDFAARWAAVERNLTWEQQLDLMEYMDVTSLMKVPEFSAYLDEVVRYYTGQGIYIAKPWEEN